MIIYYKIYYNINSMDELLKAFETKLNFGDVKFETTCLKIINNSKTDYKLKFKYHNEIETYNNLDELREKVKKLSELPHIIQRSDEWYKIRDNMITASDWASALNKNKYSSRNKLLRAKCGEKQTFFGGHMKHGIKYEPVANMIYEYRNKVNIIEFGLIQHPKYSFLGASPDGITEDGIMIEIKCPPKREITGEPPEYYWIQVQGQLEICDLDRCDFLECKIEEYSNSEEYYNDNFAGNFFLNHYGNEKGVIIVYMNKITKELSYKYSKLGINKKEYDEWILLQNTPDNSVLIGIDYWKLVDVSCIPIYRDKKWFEKNVPLLKEFWDDVLKYRIKGIDELKQKNIKQKYIDTQIQDYFICEKVDEKLDTSVCMFKDIHIENNNKEIDVNIKININIKSNKNESKFINEENYNKKFDVCLF